jgi:hypothetical protein
MSENRSKSNLARDLMDDLLNEADDSSASQKSGRRATGSKPVAKSEDDRTMDLGQHHPDATMPIVNNASSRPRVGEDRTLRVNQTLPVPVNAPVPVDARRRGEDESARASVGRAGAFRTPGQPTVTEASLAQSETLRIAQTRILDLEQEVERLRTQNEEFGAAGETLRRRADEMSAENQRRAGEYRHAESIFEQERGLLTAAKDALLRDVEAGRRRVEELELRISTNIQKIRVRERELENRLELVKMESAALIRSKDEMILEAKRTIDQLNLELGNYRVKNQELNRQSNDKQETLRRTVKALRLALSMLEGEDEAPRPAPKKVLK